MKRRSGLQWLRRLLAGVVGLALLGVVAGCAGLLHGAPPTDLGVRDGRLKPPSDRPNSVTSQAGLHPAHPRSREAAIEPLAMPPGTSAAQAIARVRQVVLAMPGATVMKEDAGYLQVVFESRLMRFHDDVEFWFDASAGVVQVRSASRVGYSDRGVNRRRVEEIRARLAG